MIDLTASAIRATERDSLIDIQQRFRAYPGRSAAQQLKIWRTACHIKGFPNRGTVGAINDQTVLKNARGERALRNFAEQAFIVFDGHLNKCHGRV